MIGHSLNPRGGCRLLAAGLPLLVLLVVAVVVLNTRGRLLRLLVPLVLAVKAVFILDKRRCLRHLLPVTILRKI